MERNLKNLKWGIQKNQVKQKKSREKSKKIMEI